MNESNEEPEMKKSLRKRLGKAIFWIGFIIIVVSIISTILVSALPPSPYDGPVLDGVGIGLLLIIIGSIAALLPEGPSKDGYWIMMMSPFAGNN